MCQRLELRARETWQEAGRETNPTVCRDELVTVPELNLPAFANGRF